MAARGRKPTSTRQKKAKGTAQPCRTAVTVVDFPIVEKVPDAPQWVSYADGISMWERMAPMLFNQRILTAADVDSLAHLCQLHGQIVDGYKRKNMPTAAELSQLRMYFSEFGMTPAGRLGLPKSTWKKKNQFDNTGIQNKPKGPGN